MCAYGCTFSSVDDNNAGDLLNHIPCVCRSVCAVYMRMTSPGRKCTHRTVVCPGCRVDVEYPSLLDHFAQCSTRSELAHVVITLDKASRAILPRHARDYDASEA